MRQLTVLFLILGLATIRILFGQENRDDQSAPTEFHYEQWQDYRVGAGDTLEIQVVNVPSMSQTLEVSAAGEIHLHPVGIIEVLDLSAAELEAKIAQVLEEKDLVRSPEVLVYVSAYRAKRIYVSGEVPFPGEFVISRNLTVLDAILLAGGLGPQAERYAFVHRRTSGEAPSGPPPASITERPDVAARGTNIFKIDLQPLQEGRPPQPDMLLRPGDYVVVPRGRIDFFFVMGEVIHPLNYPIPKGQPIRVSQAIATAGGPTTTAKISEGVLIRSNSLGERQETKVNFKAILEGRQEDIFVQPNDVIFIPGSNIKTIAEGYVRAANAMIAGTTFRIGRAYQLPDRPDLEAP